ncbi:Cytochrome c oxidase assembly protein COX19 [Geodia barretti]|uniref:Cytochrome c oxidase assembly protein COX19 n=1 Tax=Geodia barretti TaxID=519541 RepID=A0AA35STX7_GEOBA|nr:Cytochrome c oxidase assembly protein COX19 [Geodia barretti]
MPIGSQKALKPKPPDKGSFPLDHDGECRDHMMKFLSCLKEKGSDNSLCRDESRAYLQCRMDRDLMTKEDFRKLGYKEPDEINLR